MQKLAVYTDICQLRLHLKGGKIRKNTLRYTVCF
jgi:hypothetical protein